MEGESSSERVESRQLGFIPSNAVSGSAAVSPHLENESSNSTDVVDLSLLDDDDDEADPLINPDSWIVAELFNNDIDEQSNVVQDQLRHEQLIRTKLGHLYDKQFSELVVPVHGYDLTAMHFPGEERLRISSIRKLKIFYCITWFVERNKKRSKCEKCRYNLFWYEPITAFTTAVGRTENIDRAFLAFRPLLDLTCQPTNYFFVYAMYTMCNAPILTVVLYNKANGTIEFKDSYSGKKIIVIIITSMDSIIIANKTSCDHSYDLSGISKLIFIVFIIVVITILIIDNILVRS